MQLGSGDLHAKAGYAEVGRGSGWDAGCHTLPHTLAPRCTRAQVPLDSAQQITDDTRIRAAVPTLRYLLSKGARVLLASHLGRPKSGPEDRFRLAPVAPRLSQLLGVPVLRADDCVGPAVDEKVAQLERGQLLLLENVRFHKEETKNDPGFARQLAKHVDVYVNDAFGSAHRAHASTEGVARLAPVAIAGLLLQKELEYLGELSGGGV